MINPKKEITDWIDFEGYATDMLESFITNMVSEGGWTRPLEEDDGFDPEEVGDEFVIYTDRAQTLILRMIDRLNRVGKKHFPDAEISIETTMYQEP